MFYKEYRKIYDFTLGNRIPAIGDDIKYGDITMDKAKDEKNKLVQKVKDFKSNTKPRNPNMIKEKLDFINNAVTLLKGTEMVYYGSESGIFPLPNQLIVLAEPEKSNSSEKSGSIHYFECNLPETKISRRRLKLLTSKGMFQRLPIALAQVKADNTSKIVLNEIQIIYFLHRVKEISKKVYKNTMNSIEL